MSKKPASVILFKKLPTSQLFWLLIKNFWYKK